MSFIVEEGLTETQLALAIKGTKACMMKGEPSAGKYVEIRLDLKLTGETLTSPQHRCPTLRTAQVSKLLKSALAARNQSPTGLELNDDDVYDIFDAHKRGNHGVVMNCFADENGALNKTKREMIVVFSEDSIIERYNKLAEGSVQQEETLLQISKHNLIMNGRKRKTYSGTNRGTMLGPAILTPYGDDSIWKETLRVKKTIFGKANRIAVGGPNLDLAAGEDTKKKRNENMLEPVWFHEHPYDVDEEIWLQHGVVAIICLTAGNGNAGLHAIQHKIPCTLVCLTECHAKLLRQHIERRVFAAFQDESNPLYNAALVKVLAEAEAASSNPRPEGAPPKKQRKSPGDPSPGKPESSKKKLPEGIGGIDALKKKLASLKGAPKAKGRGKPATSKRNKRSAPSRSVEESEEDDDEDDDQKIEDEEEEEEEGESESDEPE